jgi:DNA helicase-2/ATP-dependent DNA helicase PcrA
MRITANSQEEWQREILAFLRALRSQGTLTDWNQVAFLFYSVRNPEVVALANFLEANKIPVYSPRADRFFERDEVRLILGALIALFPQFQEVSRKTDEPCPEIWDYYDRLCLPAISAALQESGNDGLRDFVERARQFHGHMNGKQGPRFSRLFYTLLGFPFFARHVNANVLHAGVLEQRPARNLAKVSQLLARFERLWGVNYLVEERLPELLRGLFNDFLRRLKSARFEEYQDLADYAPSGCVSFMTIHQAKGLEFPVVVVGSMESTPGGRHDSVYEGLRAHFTRPPLEPVNKMAIYDMRRLFYTAFSRAQCLLALTWVQSIRSPSKFMASATTGLPAWNDPRVRLADVPLPSLRQATFKRSYAFTSDIQAYEACAEQYRFFRVLEFSSLRKGSLMVGTLVHQTLEDIHRARVQGHMVSDEQAMAWLESNQAWLERAEGLTLRVDEVEKTRKAVMLGLREGINGSRPMRTEVRLTAVKPTYILVGKADLIAECVDGLEIVDFKTEPRPNAGDPVGRAKIDGYRRQLDVYAHLEEQRTGLLVGRTRLFFVLEEEGDPHLIMPRNAAALAATLATFDAVVARIEARDFAMAQRPLHLCLSCELRHCCTATNVQTA